MTTVDSRHRERLDVEWSARPLRPVARWITVKDEGGRSRLEMRWSVPEPVVPVDVSGGVVANPRS